MREKEKLFGLRRRVLILSLKIWQKLSFVCLQPHEHQRLNPFPSIVDCISTSSSHLQQLLINMLQFHLLPTIVGILCHNVALISNQQQNKTSLANYNEDRVRGGGDVTIINIMHDQQLNSWTHRWRGKQVGYNVVESWHWRN
jgi:hypothetical protein